MKRGTVSTMSHISNMEFITTLNKYIPSLVLQQLIMRYNSQKNKENAGKVNLPELQPMETVVLFADISGFTNLGEACAKKGARGNEELAFCINRYMEGMVTNLDQYGGDIIKFVGDAMIVMWPPVPDQETLDPQKREQARIDTIRRAIQCSQGIQKHMNNLQILKGATLSVKIGIGFGQSSILYVGGVFRRSESFTIGEALMQALKSEGNASSGGQIIVAEEAFKHVREFYKGKEIVNEVINSKGQTERELFYHIDNKYTKNVVQIKADAMKLRAQYSTDILARIQQQMQASVPQSIIPYLKIDQERFGSENRFLTVMFVSLGIELSSAKTPEGMNNIQTIMTAVQQQVYRLQGSLNKLVMDDKGSTLICLFGLMPFSHEDDASRAIAASFNLIKTLNRINNTYCNIGISSGSCFSGVVGTSGSRKEFSVLGDVVNLAARIMGSLKQDKLKNAVRCDLNTKMLASNVFDFEYHAHKEFKGKSFSTPTFTPIHPKTVRQHTNQKVLSPGVFLKLHMNPLNLEKNPPPMEQTIKTIGFGEILRSVQDDILNFSENSSDLNQPYLAIIKGQIGSGKTALVRHLISNLHEQIEFGEYLQQNKNKLPIFTSSINPETTLHIFNAWKPILQMMLTHYCKKQASKRENFLHEMIQLHNQESKTDLICKIFNVQREVMLKKFPQLFEKKQIQPNYSEIYFIKRPEYSKSEMEDLVEMLKNMVKIFIGESEDVSGFNEGGNFGGQNDSQDGMEGQITNPPHMVFIDNANQMDDLSWALLEEIVEDCYRITIVVIMQTDSVDRLKISQGNSVAFEKVWQNLSLSYQIVEKELPRLDSVQLCQLVIQNAANYQRSYTAEIKERTRIVDPKNTIKNEADGKMWTQRLTQEWQLETLMTDVDQEIMRVIATKCLGNPLMSLQYFVNMLHNGFVLIESDGYVSPTDKFNHCQFINDWTSLPVPNLAFKINCTLLDEFYYSYMVKGPQLRPGELETCTTNIVLLKSASVLGEEFELKALKKISPFPKNQTAGVNREENCLRQLEQNDFIEIVDETDQRNILCRFNKCFMRECVYQILLYKSCKKDLHAATELYLQSVPLSKDCQKNETMIAQLFEHMLLAQDAQEESELYLERRTALNVMRIQNLIAHKPRGFVLKEIIHKQGEKLNKKTEERLVTLTTKQLAWYHDERERREGTALGEVELNFIYQVMKSSQVRNERPTFLISVTMYKKNGKEMPKRDIAFSCDTEEARDKWIIAIDFLKTKAIYDEYAKKNQCVNLAMQNSNQQEELGGEQEEPRDNSNLLYDFGSQFKQLLNYVPQNQNTSFQKLGSLRVGELQAQRKSSIFKPHLDQKPNPLTASDLFPRLKILYNIGMLSFMNHLDQGSFKNKTMQVPQTTSNKGAQTDFVKMQLPVRKCGRALDNTVTQMLEIIDKDSEMKSANESQNGGRYSVSSLQAQQQILNLQMNRESSSNKKRRSTSGNDLNDKRRLSALSADNLLKQSNQSANWGQNDLIKEVDEDVSSAGESVKFGGKKKSKDFQKKASRIQSEHVTQNENSAMQKKEALKNTTSESSDAGLLSHDLSGQMTRSAKPPSSSNKFTFDLIQQNSKDPSEELRSQKPIEDKNQNLLPKRILEAQNQVNPLFSRENRQTFANQQDNTPQNNRPIIMEQDLKDSFSQKSQKSGKQQNFGQSKQEYTDFEGTDSKMNRHQSGNIDHKNKESIDFYSSKDRAHQKQLSSIHNQNDSATYRDNGGKDSLLDPLIMQNNSYSRIESSGEAQTQSMNLNQAQNNNSMTMSEDTQNTLVANLSSIIKKSFGQGIADIFTPIQEQIKAQQQIQENLLKQQQQMLDASISQNNSMIQRQMSASQKSARDASNKRKKQAKIENIDLSKRLYSFATPTRQKSANDEPTQPLFLQNSTLMPPKIISLTQNLGGQQAPQPSTKSSQMVLSEQASQGGITSVHSHKNLLNQNDSRMTAKNDIEDQPDDDPDVDGPEIGRNSVALRQPSSTKFEINMQEYFQKKIDQVKLQQRQNQMIQLRQQSMSAAGIQQTRNRQHDDERRQLFGSMNQRDIYSDNDAVQYNINLGEVGQSKTTSLNMSRGKEKSRFGELNPQIEQEEVISQKTLKRYGSNGRRFYSQSNINDNQFHQNQGEYSNLQDQQNQLYNQRNQKQTNLVYDQNLRQNQILQGQNSGHNVQHQKSYSHDFQSSLLPSSNNLAVTLKTVQDLNQNQHIIPQGQLVRVVEAFSQAGICSVEFNGVTDIYRICDFVPFNGPMSTLQPHEYVPNHQIQLLNAYERQPVQITQRAFYPQQNPNQNAHDPNQLLLMSQGLISMDQESTRTRIVGHRERTGAAQGEKTIEGISPVNAYEQKQQMNQRPNFFKESPEKEIEAKISQVNSKHLAVISKRFLDEDKKALKAANLKLEERQKRKVQAAQRAAEGQGRTVNLTGQKLHKSGRDHKPRELSSKNC